MHEDEGDAVDAEANMDREETTAGEPSSVHVHCGHADCSSSVLAQDRATSDDDSNIIVEAAKHGAGGGGDWQEWWRRERGVVERYPWRHEERVGFGTDDDSNTSA